MVLSPKFLKMRLIVPSNSCPKWKSDLISKRSDFLIERDKEGMLNKC